MTKPLLVLVAHRRSGTTALKDMLSKSGCIWFDGQHEAFRPQVNRVGNFYNFWHEQVLKDPTFLHPPRRNELIHTFVDGLREEHADEVVGLDVKYFQIRQFPYLWDAFKSMNARYIHLVRRNVVKGLVSDMLLGLERQTGERQEALAINDIKTFIRQLYERKNEIQKFQRSVEELSADGFSSVGFFYECLFNDSGGLSQDYRLAVFELLPEIEEQVVEGEWSPGIQKVNLNSCREIIVNYQELLDTIKDDWILADLVD